MDDEDWEELQQRAAGTVHLCLADEIMYHVMNLKSLGEHMNVFNQIITDLARLDVNIEDEDGAMILLCSLPFSYEHLGKVLMEIVYMSRVIRIVDGSQRRRVLENEIPDLSQGNDDSGCSDGDMLSVSTNQYVDAWILDSECSYHIKPNREWFSSYRPDEDRETIRIVKIALTVMKGKITAGNIYKPLGSTVVGGVHSIDSCDDNTKLWHMRLDSQFQNSFKEHGIQRHFSVRKTPQQNGVAERMNRFLTERARCLRLNAVLPKSFWAKAVSMACYLINRSPWASLSGKVAEEQLRADNSATNELQAYNLARDRQRRTNVKPPSKLGYEDMVSFALLVSDDEPTTFYGAITSKEKKEWTGAMVEEMESLHQNQT
ncbi:UNVERIFIED_CONTAM: Retrovirus-related Pol polyprotein from transposon TNT 1-94 [Sesamum calycinum]|uniref:Retrovirus-related Pol polyprotein from transposon TNT 1-94 n=1 Tax=Sesamum calycinum TaxID=2727403 RepID=A0AAW2S954_9LAMI